MVAIHAKVFWSGRSQAVRLPRQFRFTGTEVLVRRKGKAVILEPVDEWPDGYAASFSDVSPDLRRQPQGKADRREDFE